MRLGRDRKERKGQQGKSQDPACDKVTMRGRNLRNPRCPGGGHRTGGGAAVHRGSLGACLQPQLSMLRGVVTEAAASRQQASVLSPS